MATTPKTMTLAEFLELPEGKPALEYEDGRITRKPVSPKGKHGTIQAEFPERVNAFSRPRRLARAFTETRFNYHDRYRVPDVVVYRHERVPRDPDGKVADDFFIPPDVAVEVLSPRQTIERLIERCEWYVANDVPIALLANPRDESVRKYLPGQPAQLLRGSERIDLDAVLPGFQLTVQELFEALVV